MRLLFSSKTELGRKKHSNCPKKLQLQLLFKHDGRTERKKHVYCNSLKFNNGFLILRSNYEFLCSLIDKTLGNNFIKTMKTNIKYSDYQRYQVRLGFAFSTSSVGAKPHRVAQKLKKYNFNKVILSSSNSTDYLFLLLFIIV